MPLRRRAPSLPKPPSSTASYEHLPPKRKAKSVPCCANSADAWRRCAAPKLRRTRRRPRTGPRCQETMIAHRLFSQRSCLATERRKKSKHRAGEENPTSVVSLEGWRGCRQKDALEAWGIAQGKAGRLDPREVDRLGCLLSSGQSASDDAVAA